MKPDNDAAEFTEDERDIFDRHITTAIVNLNDALLAMRLSGRDDFRSLVAAALEELAEAGLAEVVVEVISDGDVDDAPMVKVVRDDATEAAANAWWKKRAEDFVADLDLPGKKDES